MLGMPRTGTTLVERIIGSHTGVYAAGELNNFAMELTRLAGAPGISKEELVARTGEIEFAELGRRYLESTRPATGSSARFIDKMPLNFLYAGLIHLALPAGPHHQCAATSAGHLLRDLQDPVPGRLPLFL